MQETSEHTRSCYAVAANWRSDYPELSAEHRCAVAVVGAGFTGIATALHLTEHFDVFERIRHWKLPGGHLFANPALALGMLYDRLKEIL